MTPSSNSSSAAYQWRESWPPVQLRLQQPILATAPANSGIDDGGSVAMIHGKEDGGGNQQEMHMHLADDDSPLAYFLTPAPLLSVEEDEDSYFVDDSDSSYYYENDDGDNGTGMDFEFDAGIEDATHPQPIIRSVSPSALADSLAGRLPRVVRPPTPPRSIRGYLHPGKSTDHLMLEDDADADADADADTDGYADEEHYVHFGSAAPHHTGKSASAKGKTSPRQYYHHLHYNHHLSSSPLSSSPASPRSLTDLPDLYTHHNSNLHHNAAGAMIVRRRSPRSWRVPSPDVFSIEEETEEELGTSSSSAGNVLNQTAVAAAATGRPSRHGPYLHVEAAKPQKKRVRFVLPHEEGA